jgi:hypothetical protein
MLGSVETELALTPEGSQDDDEALASALALDDDMRTRGVGSDGLVSDDSVEIECAALVSRPTRLRIDLPAE